MSKPKVKTQIASRAFRPRSKRFGDIRVSYFYHDTFGPEVELAIDGLEYKYSLATRDFPKPAAKRLRRIADWLERL